MIARQYARACLSPHRMCSIAGSPNDMFICVISVAVMMAIFLIMEETTVGRVCSFLRGGDCEIGVLLYGNTHIEASSMSSLYVISVLALTSHSDSSY